MRIDFHVHTAASPDSRSRIEVLVDLAERRGLSGFAITDHNVLTPPPASPLLLIPGEEVDTGEGEVIGLGLTEAVPPSLGLGETLDRIREQGALVVFPHPFDLLRKGVGERLDGVRGEFAVEVFNARELWPGANGRAEEFARSRGLPMVAGSDAHTYGELGMAWVEVEGTDVEEVLKNVRKGRTRVGGRKSPLYVHLSSFLARLNLL